MNIPESIKILIITLSDRASAGEYEDLSGPGYKYDGVRNIFSRLDRSFLLQLQ